ncbi:hypothetical protein LSAT2_008449 [Lamellibrachia satsuma]|nr:hypothetical protein LSAT2_008449 [Lamellibrachia satsuma]
MFPVRANQEAEEPGIESAGLDSPELLLRNTMSSTQSDDSFVCPPDSPGSSVSSRLQEEYDELLKYAVVVPSCGQEGLPRTLTDIRDSFRPMRETFPSSVPHHDTQYVDESATQYEWGETPSRLDGTASGRDGTQGRHVYVGGTSGHDTDSEETASKLNRSTASV